MLIFDKEVINLGNIKHGKSETRVINVTNLSNLNVKTYAPNGSCLCTTGIFNPVNIPANGKSELSVTFNSSKVGLGNMVKTLTINYRIGNITQTKVIKINVNVI